MSIHSIPYSEFRDGFTPVICLECTHKLTGGSPVRLVPYPAAGRWLVVLDDYRERTSMNTMLLSVADEFYRVKLGVSAGYIDEKVGQKALKELADKLASFGLKIK